MTEKNKMFDLKMGSCDSRVSKIGSCQLCNERAEYLVTAASPTFPFWGKKVQIFMCKKHQLKWARRELIL